ncbi:MAG TPA: S8 family peptidase [Bryobacteraceae bacterium]|nr:S8 family peptidase [Bryobacteraceae bacterium]
MEGVDTPDRERIRRDLVRTVIKEPLYAMILTQQEAGPIPVIIEANDEYYRGKEWALKDAADLVQTVTGSDPAALPRAHSIGGTQNPYLKATLTSAEILKLVEEDYRLAQIKQLAATRTGGTSGEGAAVKTPIAPSQVVYYLTMRRIWYDFPLRALIDRSVTTVKVDAARRAFLAEGRDVVWAVIDSGIDRAHIHFASLRTLELTLPVRHCDFTTADDPGNSDRALTDGYGHGTHVAGIIAGGFAAGQGTGIARRSRVGANNQIEEFEEPLTELGGMAPRCKLVSMKVLNDQGQGGVSNIIAAIDKIQTINDHGRSLKIHGVNLSVGYEFDPSWFACGQSPVCVEVNRLVRSGVVVVVAAGNTGYGVLSSNQRPTGAGFMLTINDPGNAEFAITVGSTHRDSPHTYGVSYFSSKGPTGDGRTKPDLVAPGERILSCCSSVTTAGNLTNVYIEDSGTSMAAPHVSGIVAAFFSIRREYIGSPEKVKQLLLSTATDLGRNPYFQGRGLVDLMRAIQSV